MSTWGTGRRGLSRRFLSQIESSETFNFPDAGSRNYSLILRASDGDEAASCGSQV